MAKPRKRWCWIWIARTLLCTGSKKSGSSTATTGITAICRCTSFVASMCCAPACGRPISAERKSGASLHRVRLSNQKQLVASPTGDRQSRTLGERGQSTVRGHLAELARNHLSRPVPLGGAKLVRGVLLRPWRDGESDKGTDDVVCRSHQHVLATEQSNPALLLHRGLPADAGSAAVGVGGHRTGQSAMPHGALKVAQDRGPDSHHGTQSLGVAVERLSLPGTISPGAPAVASCSSALLRGRK